MSASQFTESQKAQMVEQYRAGHSSVAVGKRFGCSDRTVMRFVRDLVGATEFEALKERNRSAAQRKPASNFTGQFTESQKARIVEQYRAGHSSVAVGKRFGCSDRTVMRLVRARLSSAELEALKEQNRKRPQTHTTPATPDPSATQKKPTDGATGQLTERQKARIVEQYRAGHSSVAVGKRFGCSDRTVMRLVRARLSSAELEALKEQNRKRPQAHATPATPDPSAMQKKPTGGATGQLTERQKARIVEQYRAGHSSVAVGKRFGCSDRTVMRLVRARLNYAELEALKEQNRKRPQARTTPATPESALVRDRPSLAAEEEPMDNVTGPQHLPWDDADDFAENGGKENDGAVEDDDTALPATSRRGVGKGAGRNTEAARAVSLDVNQLPSPLYLLVERSVELQPQTLGSLHHLGPLDTDERQRQGLVLFSNVRQARRQCRRNQRIVKVADPRLLGKTAPHLLAQGISRLVIEGALYALPGSAAAARP